MTTTKASTPYRDQHFLPKFYTKAWVSPDGEGVKAAKDKVWLYRKFAPGTEWRPEFKSPRQIGSEEDLYPEFPGLDADHSLEAKFFQKVDSDAASVFHHVRSAATEDIEWTNKRAFSRFLLSLIERHPVFLAVQHARLKGRFVSAAEQVIQQGPDPESRQRILDVIRKMDAASVDHNFPRKMMVRRIDDEERLQEIEALNWTVVDRDEPKFITTERPLVESLDGVPEPERPDTPNQSDADVHRSVTEFRRRAENRRRPILCDRTRARALLRAQPGTPQRPHAGTRRAVPGQSRPVERRPSRCCEFDSRRQACTTNILARRPDSPMTRRTLALLGLFLLVGLFAVAYLIDRWWQSLGTQPTTTATADTLGPTEQCPSVEVRTPQELSVVAKQMGGAEGFAIDASGFYWSSGLVEPFSIRRARPGKSASALVPKLSSKPEHVAVDAKNVYWSGESGIVTVPKEGGAVTELATAGGPIVADAEGIFWASNQGVFRLPSGSKEIVKMTGTDFSAKAIGTTPREVIVGRFGLNAISRTSNAVRKLTDHEVDFLVVDGDEVYSSDGQAVRRTNLTSGVTVPIGPARPCNNTVMGMAVDAKNIYLGCWLIRRGPVTNDLGSVVALPKAGGCPVALASKIDWPKHVVTFEGAVYWNDYDQIRRLVP